MEPAKLIVRKGDCPCPGKPHLQEEVLLEPTLTLPMVSGGLAAMRGATTIPEMEGRLFQGFFPIGIRSWSFLDAAGDAPVTAENIETYLPLEAGGFELVEFAREHYMPRFGGFLASRIATLSAPGQTDDSTSPSPPSGSQRPARSRQSSHANGAGKPFVAPAR